MENEADVELVLPIRGIFPSMAFILPIFTILLLHIIRYLSFY
jgi:hypothetical protein